jgi:hypothetical protein
MLLGFGFHPPELPFHDYSTSFYSHQPFGLEEGMESDPYVGPDSETVLFEFAEIWA